jgi:gamma-glutamyltranspeptidase
MQRDSPLPEETLSVLGDRGYKTRSIYNYGDIQMIYDDGKDVQAASDPRNRGESRVIDVAREAATE